MMTIVVLVCETVLYPKNKSSAVSLFKGVESALHSFHDHDHNHLCFRKEPKSVLAQLDKEARRHSYPLDLFEQNSSDSQPCHIWIANLDREIHYCSSSGFECPLNPSHLPILMASFDNASAQICDSLAALEKRRPVRIIIFGGSVTQGHIAGGCIDGTCNDGKPCDVELCRWGLTFGEYIRDHMFSGNKNIELLDASVGGTGSCFLPRHIPTFLHLRNITLSKDDIMIMDYSVNDGCWYSKDPAKLRLLNNCLVNTLQSLAQNTAGGVLPTVLLLEFWPFSGYDLDATEPVDFSYADSYRGFAKEYHIPIVSHRSLFWSETFRKDLQQHPKLEYVMRYKYGSPNSIYIHPPWVTHDFYADLMVAVFDRSRTLCRHRAHTVVEISKEIIFENLRGGNSKDIVLIDEDANNNKAPLLNKHQILELPYEWKHYQDRPRKPGWIIENHHISKNNSSSSPPLPLTFTTIWTKHEIPTTVNAILEISYMSTYLNAGGFRVEVCGHNITWVSYLRPSVIVDTLVNDHVTTRETVVFQVPLQSLCQSNEIVVQIVHIMIWDDRIVARGTQKVKIYWIRLTIPKPVFP
jgi:hypothetical protein